MGNTNYIFITGGVMSSLGKGLASASIAALLQARGFSVRCRKFDPYLNVDPGLMDPLQHGEVFVTEDGIQADLDLGHYERFTNVSAKKSDYATTGEIYSYVLNRERKGEYNGVTVQVVPHIVQEIKRRMLWETQGTDFVLYEIGGTVGDIEGLPFLEACRQMRSELGHERTMFVHLTYVPFVKTAGEIKTKPTQHSVKELLREGIQPDLLLCRCSHMIPAQEKEKISMFCNVKLQNVITALDNDCIYDVPTQYHKEGLDGQVCKYFNIDPLNHPFDKDWEKSWGSLVNALRNPEKEINVAIVGRYSALPDAYKSIIEAIRHSSANLKVKANLIFVDIKEKQNVLDEIKNADAILVPGGSSSEYNKNIIAAINFAKENDIALLGICFGMHLIAMEGLANDDKTAYPSVKIKELNDKFSQKGKLGSFELNIRAGSALEKIYKKTLVSERYIQNTALKCDFEEELNATGLFVTGVSTEGNIDAIERKDKKFFVGVQFHPEFKSRALKPHPIFIDFIKSATL